MTLATSSNIDEYVGVAWIGVQIGLNRREVRVLIACGAIEGKYKTRSSSLSASLMTFSARVLQHVIDDVVIEESAGRGATAFDRDAGRSANVAKFVNELYCSSSIGWIQKDAAV